MTELSACPGDTSAAITSSRLILAPPAILNYVVVHELCHRIHHDHSAGFWVAVATARPTYAEERSWLAEHGPELLAYRVPKRRAA